MSDGWFYLFSFSALIVMLVWRLYHAGMQANRVDWGGRWVNCFDGLIRIFCLRFHRFEFEPIELPAHGGAIVVCNHISGLDPLLLQVACRRPLRFIIAQEQHDRPGLRRLFDAMGCISIDRKGRPELAMRQALRQLLDGEVIAIFPQGGIHPSGGPPGRLKRGAARLATMARCPVYPARISGVGGEGHVLRALLHRSHARLVTLNPHLPDNLTSDELHELLVGQLMGQVSAVDETSSGS
ncbi:MAG TPA: 1-acyl-sn-glycerol-3-phosphate acyltransferase [Chromatiaceae bacterium]|jgi:1-acyl-sn-glycerol-3-phosphate acyltransferase|nr:1-acyl-sn-glycerol-3-phosphate acyltransferase [Chromatiaceae bacterium]HIN82289.1 1-acyl-sn-glycerol-3-phosphate acyltransferase [Chromatiales bacterium]HIA09139.1 1-acyl-sn-glycerol-3-phosphate acyltransferase [Chromatiaceae bacterium]HIB84300.1 1-acyl-sn-glycerol-3-phosphate acyltransferase [Chromatiaceae bacterium]HIO15125.1 1-acyl-sn-glycerol-3-phosphate acyltransferase [Chromatiales bacterium]